MRKLILILTPLFFCLALTAQDKVGDVIALADVPESIALVTQVKSYANAVQSNNYEKVAELTHPDVINMGGGQKFIISDLKVEGDQLKSQGFTYTGIEVGNHPEFLVTTEEIQTVIPVKYFMSLNSKVVESWSNLFAVSSDEGMTWKFVNLDKFDEASLREFVSNVSPELVYPTR